MKKSMLTILFAVSAVMAFAAPAKEARIDILNIGSMVDGENAPISELKIADQGTAVRAITPQWLIYKNAKAKLAGKGAVVVFKLNGSDWQTGTATLTAVGSGTLSIRLKGPFIRDPKTKQCIKTLVDYQKFVVNGKTVYEGKDGKFLTVWHNKPYTIKNIAVKDGDTIKIEVTVRPTAEEAQ